MAASTVCAIEGMHVIVLTYDRHVAIPSREEQHEQRFLAPEASRGTL